MINKFTPLLLFISLVSTSVLMAQECDSPSQTYVLNVNNIEARFGNSANFFDYGQEVSGTFKNKDINAEVAGIFASSIWIGGKKDSGEFAFTGATYRPQGPSIFQSGPYPQNGFTDPDVCSNYDQMFVVNRFQLSNHLSDFADNGQLDNPIDEILGWPGLGNPNFEMIHGFSLPENVAGGLAPFFDHNADGIYNPYDGDYPLPNGVDPNMLPETIVWWIFNDTNQLQGTDPLGVEVQVTVWAFQCTDNEVLNNTIFSNHKVTNYSGEEYQDLKFGLWTDFDLGCDFDDHIGSAPDHNTYFAYNKDPVDGIVPDDCGCIDIPSFCETPPAVGVTFLNHEMSAFTYYNRSFSTPPPLPGTGQPQTSPEYHHFMSGRWSDGTPLTKGGNGYNLASTNTTNFAFPGDPSLSDEWSMHQVSLALGDRRVVGSIHIGNWQAQQSFSVDMAYASFQNPDLDHLGQVGHLLTQVEEIQSIYDDGFSTMCTTNDFCESDCVWPGDANSDGIVNHCDLFPIGLAFSENETNRFAPIYWAPFDSEPWTNSLFNGTNHKHADCNGDGIVDENDQDLISQFYLQTHGNYVESPDQYQEGPELYFDIQTVIGSTIQPGTTIFINLKTNIPEPIYGLSFELEYDWDFLDESTSIFGFQNYWESSDPQYPILNSFIRNPVDRSQIYTNVRTDGQDISNPDQILGTIWAKLKLSDLPPGDLCEQSMIRLKNIKGILADGSPVTLGGTDFTIPLSYCETTSISNQEESPITIHPNPTTDQVWINWNEYPAERIEILDITGKVLSQVKANADQNVISLTAFAKGIYFVRVIGQKGSPTFKIVKN